MAPNVWTWRSRYYGHNYVTSLPLRRRWFYSNRYFRDNDKQNLFRRRRNGLPRALASARRRVHWNYHYSGYFLPRNRQRHQLQHLGSKRTIGPTSWRLHKVNATWLLLRSRIQWQIWTWSPWHWPNYFHGDSYLDLRNTILDPVGDFRNSCLPTDSRKMFEMAVWCRFRGVLRKRRFLRVQWSGKIYVVHWLLSKNHSYPLFH